MKYLQDVVDNLVPTFDKLDEAGKQLTYKTDSGEIAPKKLDGLIMQAIKMYGMDPEALSAIRDAVLDDYMDSDISQVSVQDIVEIMDASGFEPGDDEDEDADDIFYDKETYGKWVKRKLEEDDGKMSLTFKQFLIEGSTNTLEEPPLPKNFWTAARGAEAKHFRTKWMQNPSDELKKSYHAAMADRHFDLAQRAEKRSDDKAMAFHTKEGNRHIKPLKESADDLEQAKKELESAKKDNESRSANWQTKERLSAAYDKVADIKKQAERDSGKLNSASIIVPDDKVERIAKDLHAMGKTKDGFKSPWRMVRGGKKGTVVVRFDDYDTKNTGSGHDVDDMINHVKKFEV